MSVQVVQVRIKGESPLIMNRFPMEPIKGLDKKTPAEQAEVGAYRDEAGRLYVPANAVQRCLINGAKYSKGKGRATLAKVAAACLDVRPARLLLNQENYVIDSRAVVNPSTGGRIVRHRPIFDQWEISFDLHYEDTLLSMVQVRQIVDDGGMRAGLLDHRPDRGGPNGRFKVVSWKD